MWKNTLTFLLMCFISMSTSAVDIQSMLDRLPNSGGVVDLPSGIIEINTPILLYRSNQSLIGHNTTIILKNRSNCPAILIGDPVNQPKYFVTNILVKDLIIDGNRKNQSQELWKSFGDGSNIRNNGITIQSTLDSKIEGVICKSARSGGLVTTMNVSGLTVTNFEAYDNEFDGIGGYLTTKSLFIDLNLHDNVCAGLSFDLSFDDNIINNSTISHNDIGIFMRASHTNSFSNIKLMNNNRYGMFIADSFASENSDCSYNTFNMISLKNNPIKINDLSCTNNVIIIK